MLNEADKILENHRVDVKHTASRDATIRLASGKVIPIHEEFRIFPDLDFEEQNLITQISMSLLK